MPIVFLTGARVTASASHHEYAKTTCKDAYYANVFLVSTQDPNFEIDFPEP